jgi:hypothetical protein
MKNEASIGTSGPTAQVEQELDWFFNRAACDMGEQSNYLAMLGPLGPGSRIPSPEDAAEAAHRARWVGRWLLAIGTSDTGVLRCAYELRAWPVALWDRLGRLTGVVVRLACALDGLTDAPHLLRVVEMARADWLAAQAPRAAIDPTWARLRGEARNRLARATLAYERARAATPTRAGGGAR